MNDGANVSQLQLWANQLVYLFEYGVLFLFVSGILIVVLGVIFIAPASQPQNSASWMGRQVNPLMCVATLAGGTLLISIGALLEFWIEVLTGMDAGRDSPLHWGTTNSRSEDELVRFIGRMGMAIMGLYAAGKGVANLTKLGSQDPPKHPIGSTVGMFLLAAVFFVPNKVAGWLSGFLPFFGVVASALEVSVY